MLELTISPFAVPQITVKRMLPSDNGPVSDGSATQTLILSPTVPVAKSTEGNVLARLPGDLASYTQLPVFSDRYLMIPQTAAQVREASRRFKGFPDPKSLNATEFKGTCTLV